MSPRYATNARPQTHPRGLLRLTKDRKIERWFREGREVLEALDRLGALYLAFEVARTRGVRLLDAFSTPKKGNRLAATRQAVVAAVVHAHALSIRGAACLFGLDRTSVRRALRSVAAMP